MPVHDDRSKQSAELIGRIISSPEVEYSVVPKSTMRFADFLHKTGRIKRTAGPTFSFLKSTMVRGVRTRGTNLSAVQARPAIARGHRLRPDPFPDFSPGKNSPIAGASLLEVENYC